ncbi:hypothetical protein [Streptacidiphilus sp. EB103A]|uniref:hypothetical protein n=1 Tax=Streptacidiphilus sp. EB103A TaxID=3156275 RepID=UPI00351215A6
MSVMPGGAELPAEVVVVDPAHLEQIVRTHFASAHRSSEVVAALDALLEAVEPQADEPVWVLPAEPLWITTYFADPLRVYALDQDDQRTYDDERVFAQHWVSWQISTMAPRTEASMSAAVASRLEEWLHARTIFPFTDDSSG